MSGERVRFLGSQPAACSGRAILAGMLACLAVVRASADTVYFEDGSQLVGEVSEWTEGELRVEGTFADTLTVDTEGIVGLTTEEDKVVALESGDELVGRLSYSPGDGQRVVNPRFGELEIDPGSIRGLWLPEEEDPAHRKEVEEVRQEYQEKTEMMQAEIAKREDPWSGSLEFGVSGKTGNTDRLGVRGRAEARRETDMDRVILDLQGRYAEQDGERSENEIQGGGRLEVDVTERFFTRGNLRLESDEFEDLDLRVRATAGVGYFLLKKPDHEFKVFGSPGYQHETFRDGTTVDEAIMELGWNYMYEFQPWLLFTQDTTVIPSLEDANNFRVEADTAGEIPLDGEGIWKLRLGVSNDYDNQPAPGFEELDTTYYANITFSFD